MPIQSNMLSLLILRYTGFLPQSGWGLSLLPTAPPKQRQKATEHGWHLFPALRDQLSDSAGGRREKPTWTILPGRFSGPLPRSCACMALLYAESHHLESPQWGFSCDYLLSVGQGEQTHRGSIQRKQHPLTSDCRGKPLGDLAKNLPIPSLFPLFSSQVQPHSGLTPLQATMLSQSVKNCDGRRKAERGGKGNWRAE